MPQQESPVSVLLKQLGRADALFSVRGTRIWAGEQLEEVREILSAAEEALREAPPLAPAELFKRAGRNCPGLPYPPSERIHPESCAAWPVPLGLHDLRKELRDSNAALAAKLHVGADSVYGQLETLKADLCAHSIAARKADDDLDRRIAAWEGLLDQLGEKCRVENLAHRGEIARLKARICLPGGPPLMAALTWRGWLVLGGMVILTAAWVGFLAWLVWRLVT